MKRMIQGTMLFLITAAVIFFNFAGGSIRDWLSPEVTCQLPDYCVYHNNVYIAVPISSIQSDETTGQISTWLAVPSDKFPELSYAAVLFPIIPIEQTDETLYVSVNTFPVNSKIIISSHDALEEGQRICCYRNGCLISVNLQSWLKYTKDG